MLEPKKGLILLRLDVVGLSGRTWLNNDSLKSAIEKFNDGQGLVCGPMEPRVGFPKPEGTEDPLSVELNSVCGSMKDLRIETMNNIDVLVGDFYPTNNAVDFYDDIGDVISDSKMCFGIRTIGRVEEGSGISVESIITFDPLHAPNDTQRKEIRESLGLPEIN